MGFSLYARTMFYYHWLIKKLLWSMIGQSIARLKGIYGESRRSQGRHLVAAEGATLEFAGRSQPRGNT